MLKTSLIFYCFCISCFAQQNGYYWREYTGVIPEDAFEAGKDINGETTYVGQAYIKDRGIIVAQIFKGVRQVSASIYGVKKSKLGNKILCSTSPFKFSWLATSSKKLQVDTIEKHPVLGGVEGDRYLHVCRIQSEGETKIGKVYIGGWTGGATCYYVDGGRERNVKNFEVLLYNGDSKVDYLPLIDVRLGE